MTKQKTHIWWTQKRFKRIVLLCVWLLTVWPTYSWTQLYIQEQSNFDEACKVFIAEGWFTTDDKGNEIPIKCDHSILNYRYEERFGNYPFMPHYYGILLGIMYIGPLLTSLQHFGRLKIVGVALALPFVLLALGIQKFTKWYNGLPKNGITEEKKKKFRWLAR